MLSPEERIRTATPCLPLVQKTTHQKAIKRLTLYLYLAIMAPHLKDLIHGGETKEKTLKLNQERRIQE